MNKQEIRLARKNKAYLCAKIAIIYENGTPGYIWVDLDVKDLLETMKNNRVKEVVTDSNLPTHTVIFCEPQHEKM